MLPGVVGVMMATEAIKLLVGIGIPLIGRLVLYDALRMQFRELKLSRDANCPVCGDKPEVTELYDDYDVWYDEYWVNAPAVQVATAAD